MPYCAIITCKKRSQTSSISRGGVSFHRFPKDPNTRERWIDATGRENWMPTKSSTICSEHFGEDDFIIKKSGYRFIKPEAFPNEKIVQVYSSSLANNTYDSSSNNAIATNCKLTCVNVQDFQGADTTCAITTNSVLSTPKKEKFVTGRNIKGNVSRSNILTPRKRKLQNIIDNKENIIKKQRLQIKKIQAQNRRLKLKVNKIQDVLYNLQSKFSLQNEDVYVLQNINIKVQELRNRMLAKQIGNRHLTQKYSPALRSFALTLDYYSPKAYEYVRKTFNTCLPNRRTLRKWYQNIGGDPGFTLESIEALKIKVKSTKYPIIAALSIDEMAIRRRVEWDGKKLHGHVDIGNGVEGDHVGIAKEALVFLITGVNCNFKVPVGYFLVDGIIGRQRADLVLQCLEMITETGIKVISLTFDGSAANMAMTRCLNCSIKDQRISFLHPSTYDPIVVVLDPSHMIKLIRNALQSYNVFLDKNNNNIEWRFLANLNEVQMKENFHLANKLRYQHINFKNNKMKVKLATQLFSLSVADAIDFCRDKLNLPSFKNSESTTYFLRIINNMFDIFNSRNTYEYNYKKALSESNAAILLSYLEMATEYLSGLKTQDGLILTESLRSTGFNGFIGCAAAFKHFYVSLIKPQVISFLPFYKVSQDHLEMLFGNIRSHGGGNNNPTARQFKSAYKKLLVHIELKALDSGNCTALEHVSILNCAPSPTDRINRSTRRFELDNLDPEVTAEEEEFDVGAFVDTFSEFSSQIIGHIAGYVAHVLLKKIECDTCTGALLSTTINDEHKFIVAKDKGGLLYPSKDLIQICKVSESFIKIKSDNLHFGNKDIIISKILRHFVGSEIFDTIVYHQIGQYPFANHITDLIKAIADKYINVRMHFILKNSFARGSKRQMFNKYVLFQGH